MFDIDLGWKGAFHSLSFIGGPFDYFIKHRHDAPALFGFCARDHDHEAADVTLPIRDFQTPEGTIPPSEVAQALTKALTAALRGQDVYVGCMGGWGRTGLVLALLVKATGVTDDPVAFVRAHYNPRAVETADQAEYVAGFDVAPVRRRLFVDAWKHKLGLL